MNDDEIAAVAVGALLVGAAGYFVLANQPASHDLLPLDPIPNGTIITGADPTSGVVFAQITVMSSYLDTSGVWQYQVSQDGVSGTETRADIERTINNWISSGVQVTVTVG